MKINKEQIKKIAKKLTLKGRRRISSSNFAIPNEKKYPIHDISHARNALARVSQHGTSEEKKKVRSAVYSKYPQLKKEAQVEDRVAELIVEGIGRAKAKLKRNDEVNNEVNNDEVKDRSDFDREMKYRNMYSDTVMSNDKLMKNSLNKKQHVENLKRVYQAMKGMS